MSTHHKRTSRAYWIGVLAAAALWTVGRDAGGQAGGPEMVDSALSVRAVVSGLDLPIGIAFLAAHDMLVLEKNSGLVKRVVNGVVTGTVLDLGVNQASERGMLGIALHPEATTTAASCGSDRIAGCTS